MDLIIAILYMTGIYVIYRILDRLVRIPKIGNYGEKYILVTGCDTGFGHEITKVLDRLGCHVFAACLTEKGETELKKQCSKRVQTVPMDVSDSESVRKAYDQVEKALPQGKGLWGMINNAGIGGKFAPAEWLTLKDYQQVLDINLLGLIDVTVTFLPLVKRGGGGRIVNTASMLGRWTLQGVTPYCVSKYGVESFSDSLRRQLRIFNISVHIIEPGFYRTNIILLDEMEKTLRKVWEEVPKDIQDEYGEQYVEASVKYSVKEFVNSVASEHISDVINAYEHAMLGKFPRARYLLGTDANYFLWPLNILPEWLSDWLMEKSQGKNRPIPDCIRNGTYRK